MQTAFDYIVLGAGSAGSIVAAELCKALPDSSVLLVEAGPKIAADENVIWDPTQWALVAQQGKWEWGYESVPQKNLNNRVIKIGRAKGLGGCAIHNAMVYVRGGYRGFDHWAASGNLGWSYKEVLPYFEKVEDTLLVTIAKSDPLIDALVAACRQQGIPYNANYNQNSDQVCIAPFQFAISPTHRRETSYSSFLPQTPPNLTVLTHCLIERIIIDNSQTARGVVLRDLANGTVREVSASQEVVLSAGTIGSPQLLMLSGVGDPDELAQFQIPVVSALPGVGKNFQDDLFVTAGFQSPQPLPPQPYGLMGTVIFANSTNHNPLLGTDLESSLATSSMAGMPGNLPKDSWYLYPNIQLLKSRGTVKLRSENPMDKPIIDPNFLDDPSDIQNCLDGLKLAMQIGNDTALSDWASEQLMPTQDDDLEAYIRQTADTCYHYAGTCKMGIDVDAVVTPDLKVRGVHNLRVIDASIIPTTVSGNTAAATMMIAMKGSELILQDT
ncbi:MAG TPA: choline dehydrogenase [Cytophagales bacterium]|nr:choline dehydrogenase [Cytophagales bacterium]HAA19644.1 choline dehydrogenase [Cytophagales bacterium]HAP60225.1 choline dehydrogenase [Cytophagales bacterium]